MVDSNSHSPPGPTVVAAPTPVWLVPLALSLWGISLLLFIQGAVFLKWTVKNKANAPHPRAGIGPIGGLSAFIFFFYFFQPSLAHRTDLLLMPLALITFPFKEQETFSQVFLFSSLLFGALAIFKYVLAFSIGRTGRAEAKTLAHSPAALVIGAVFTLLQVVGSIASILAFFR